MTNSAVALVREYYTDNYNGASVLPVLGDDTSPKLVYITGLNGNNPLRGYQDALPPLSRHERGAAWTYKGNFLFMDGHVEWVETPSLTPKCNDMFPTIAAVRLNNPGLPARP